VFAWCDGDSCVRDGYGFLEVWFLRGGMDGVGLDNPVSDFVAACDDV